MTEPSTPLGSDPYRTPARTAAELGDLHLPYEGQTHMRLSIAHGISSARVRVDPDASALIAISGPAPRVRVVGDDVRLVWSSGFGDWLRNMLAGEHEDVDIVLHPAVAWTLSVRGGVSSLQCDMRHGLVTRIDVSGGCSDVELELPQPPHEVPIRIAGGASRLCVRRPADVGVSVEVHGGLASLRLDDRSFDAIGGEARLETTGRAGDPRYRIRVSGGASDVDVEAA